jgi:hypothetical protein
MGQTSSFLGQATLAFLEYLSFCVIPLLEVLAAAVLLRGSATESLREQWWTLSALSVVISAITPTITFILLLRLYAYPLSALPQALFAASAMAIVAVALLSLVVRWRYKAAVSWPLLWTGIIAAELSFLVKLEVGGWAALGEMIFGIYFAVPVVHVLVRLITSSSAGAWRMTTVGLTSDVMILLTTLLRIDDGEPHTYVVYERLLFGRYVVPDWMTWGGAYPPEMAFDLCLYVPLIALWFVGLRIANRERQSRSSASGA